MDRLPLHADILVLLKYLSLFLKRDSIEVMLRCYPFWSLDVLLRYLNLVFLKLFWFVQLVHVVELTGILFETEVRHRLGRQRGLSLPDHRDKLERLLAHVHSILV